MTDRWTVRRMIAWMSQDFASAGITTARLDAELLVADALGCTRIDLYLDLERPLVRDELDRLRSRVIRRRRFEPIAYILGQREFFGRTFHVTSDVLVPRPDTEVVVERTLVELDRLNAERVLDLCTGSGAIGVTLAAERPSVCVDLTDISEAALAVCRRNAEQLGVAERVRLFAGDLFDAVPPGTTYDLVVANPPYVAPEQWPRLAPDIVDFEPETALVAPEHGYAIHRRIVEQAPSWLRPEGCLVVEIGAGQSPEVQKLFEGHLSQVTVHEDLARIPRVVVGRRG